MGLVPTIRREHLEAELTGCDEERVLVLLPVFPVEGEHLASSGARRRGIEHPRLHRPGEEVGSEGIGLFHVEPAQ